MVNDQLFKASANANMFANILMPIIGNLGYLSYDFDCHYRILTGTQWSGWFNVRYDCRFLQLNRSFNNPIGQISQQINSVVMAAAGASRIFELIDTPSEVDDGKSHFDQCGNS